MSESGGASGEITLELVSLELSLQAHFLLLHPKILNWPAVGMSRSFPCILHILSPMFARCSLFPWGLIPHGSHI